MGLSFWGKGELIPAVLILVISEGTKGKQKPETLDLFVFEHFDMYVDFCSGLFVL